MNINVKSVLFLSQVCFLDIFISILLITLNSHSINIYMYQLIPEEFHQVANLLKFEMIPEFDFHTDFFSVLQRR